MRSVIKTGAYYLLPQRVHKQLFSTASTLANMSESKVILPGTEDWEAAWAKGVAKGMRWDIGKCEPDLAYELALKDKGTLAAVFAKPRDAVRALVPGCGRGYPVEEIAKHGIKSMGFDLSATAMKLAKEESVQPKAEYIVGDFFAPSDLGTFDLIFDSTFLCAISPLQWRDWAKRMNELLAPEGLLALQVFPVFEGSSFPERDPDHPGDEPGPPNRLTIKLIRELLNGYPVKEIAFRPTPPERKARGDFLVRDHAVQEYWMVFQKSA